MKKILLTSLLSVGALGVHAQGTLYFTDYDNLISHIWSPPMSSPGVAVAGTTQVSGNSSTATMTAAGFPAQDYDTPAGTTTYPGAIPLGGSAVSTGANGIYGNGTLFTVQLEALAGSTSVALSSLLPVTQYTATLNTANTATTGTFAGQWTQPTFASDPGIPGTSSTGYLADIAVAAWYSGPSAGGVVGVSSLAAAETTPGAVWGESPEVVGFQTAEPQSLEPVGTIAPFPSDQTTTSFGLVQNATASPEPGTIALGVMAAGAFLARRRKA
jgi:hypothetical protein